MAEESKIFRKVSLERLSSPEQLDQLMTVTTPCGWISLAAIGGVILTALLWSIFGTIPKTVKSQGILIRGGFFCRLGCRDSNLCASESSHSRG